MLGATIDHVDPGWTALVLGETSTDLQGTLLCRVCLEEEHNVLLCLYFGLLYLHACGCWAACKSGRPVRPTEPLFASRPMEAV